MAYCFSAIEKNSIDSRIASTQFGTTGGWQHTTGEVTRVVCRMVYAVLTLIVFFFPTLAHATNTNSGPTSIVVLSPNTGSDIYRSQCTQVVIQMKQGSDTLILPRPIQLKITAGGGSSLAATEVACDNGNYTEGLWWPANAPDLSFWVRAGDSTPFPLGGPIQYRIGTHTTAAANVPTSGNWNYNTMPYLGTEPANAQPTPVLELFFNSESPTSGGGGNSGGGDSGGGDSGGGDTGGTTQGGLNSLPGLHTICDIQTSSEDSLAYLMPCGGWTKQQAECSENGFLGWTLEGGGTNGGTGTLSLAMAAMLSGTPVKLFYGGCAGAYDRLHTLKITLTPEL